MQVTLTRTKYTSEGVLGRLDVPGIKRTLYTLEQPWRNNRKGESCIPTGDYGCIPHGWEDGTPVHKKKVWEVTNVPGDRNAILFHVGNYPKDSKGCILVGTSTSGVHVWHSSHAISAMRSVIGRKNFNLKIQDEPVDG